MTTGSTDIFGTAPGHKSWREADATRIRGWDLGESCSSKHSRVKIWSLQDICKAAGLPTSGSLAYKQAQKSMCQQLEIQNELLIQIHVDSRYSRVDSPWFTLSWRLWTRSPRPEHEIEQLRELGCTMPLQIHFNVGAKFGATCNPLQTGFCKLMRLILSVCPESRCRLSCIGSSASLWLWNTTKPSLAFSCFLRLLVYLGATQGYNEIFNRESTELCCLAQRPQCANMLDILG